MSAAAIIEQARALGVRLRVEGDKIKWKGPRPGVEQILPALREHKPELLTALASPRPEPAESGTRWLLLDKSRLYRLPFASPQTRSELEARHPGCLVLRLPDDATGRELVDLVAKVAAREKFTRAEIDEALERALADPEHALVSFRLLAQGSRT